jgi:hypothetical protein
MAKALIAAVSLAVVLVAAVVVPLVVMPGIFGYHDWPTATPHAPHEQVVSLSVRAVHTAPAPAERQAAPIPAPAPRPVVAHQQLAQVAPPAAVPAPTAVQGRPQADQPHKTHPEQPLAAHEAPLPPPTVDARPGSTIVPDAVKGEVRAVEGLDGTNQP